MINFEKKGNRTADWMLREVVKSELVRDIDGMPSDFCETSICRGFIVRPGGDRFYVMDNRDFIDDELERYIKDPDVAKDNSKFTKYATMLMNMLAKHNAPIDTMAYGWKKINKLDRILALDCALAECDTAVNAIDSADSSRALCAVSNIQSIIEDLKEAMK